MVKLSPTRSTENQLANFTLTENDQLKVVAHEKGPLLGKPSAPFKERRLEGTSPLWQFFSLSRGNQYLKVSLNHREMLRREGGTVVQSYLQISTG